MVRMSTWVFTPSRCLSSDLKLDKNDQKVLEQKAKSHQTGREKDKEEETVEKIL